METTRRSFFGMLAGVATAAAAAVGLKERDPADAILQEIGCEPEEVKVWPWRPPPEHWNCRSIDAPREWPAIHTIDFVSQDVRAGDALMIDSGIARLAIEGEKFVFGYALSGARKGQRVRILMT